MQLVINTFGTSLRKRGDRFVITAGDRKADFSAHKVRSILISTSVHLSSDVIELAVAHNIDVVFLSKDGDPYARAWQTKMGSTAAIRRRQLEAAETEEGLNFAKGWVASKLRNQIELLGELARRRPDRRGPIDATAEIIRDSLERVESLNGTLDEQRATLMGLEGSAGRSYFARLGRMLPEGYRFARRSRSPAADGFNALLNYGYGILYSLVERACICAGLDPHLGFLHTDNYNKTSLVFDLIEPFRILAERSVLLLFTGRRAQQSFFEEVPGGVSLSAEGKAFFIPHFNERLDKTVRYPVRTGSGKSRNVKQRDVIRSEAHALANALLGREDIPTVVETRQLFEEE